MASKILIANFKMNPESEKEALNLAKSFDFKNVVIAPPFVFLESLSNVLKNAKLCAQDVFYEKSGAYTGEISTIMLKKLGVKYVIVGHSERRCLGETDEVIAKKIKAVINSGLKVILCVGEPLSIKKRGDSEVKKYIKKQLNKISNLKSKNLLIAYEPIWAIGTGKNASPEYASLIAKFIKSVLSVPVLYGGSTNYKNSKSFLERDEINGLLVGGASLDKNEFKKMIYTSERCYQ